MRRFLIFAAAALPLLLTVACSSSATEAQDAGMDTGIDAGVDAGVDAGADAGADAGSDAGQDATVAAPQGVPLRLNSASGSMQSPNYKARLRVGGEPAGKASSTGTRLQTGTPATP